MIRNFFLVGIGGMLGTLLRYGIYLLVGTVAFPFATLAVNISGSFAIGMVTAIAAKNIAIADWRIFITTGICGGFTTFSAFSLECIQLLQQSRNIAAFVYIIVSVCLGVGAAYAGYLIGK